jgi:predicted component of type VI protein secretion system
VDIDSVEEIRKSIRDDIEQFEPRVKVERVDAQVTEGNEILVRITIRFLGERISDSRSFVVAPNESIRLLNMGR